MGWFDGELVAVTNELFEREGYRRRSIRLSGNATVADRDTHPRLSPPQTLAKLRTVYADGVQTSGNSSALTDGAAAALVASGAVMRDWGRALPAPVAAAVVVVGVAPEVMGIGPIPTTASRTTARRWWMNCCRPCPACSTSCTCLGRCRRRGEWPGTTGWTGETRLRSRRR